MFPHPGRKAAPAKEMRALQQLLGEHDAAADAALFEWARQQPVRRVVVKRPLKAPPLGRVAPHHTLRGRSVRFDVYQPPAAE
jgi:16S rRNA (guanine1516-N2)-methyltransferase